MTEWYQACVQTASAIEPSVPEMYRSRTFSGIIGDIKSLPSRKALSLISRKRGLGLRYAYLYLTTGIDNGRGYQACAAEALKHCLGDNVKEILRNRVLDIGCAVGVTAGIFGLEEVTGLDLFTDLLTTAQTVDNLTGHTNHYITADMTNRWPLGNRTFSTVTCGLVCHHLKNQRVVSDFFMECNRVLVPGGALVITLPSGTIANAGYFRNILNGLRDFGFHVDTTLSGLVLSTDSERSLFWMFQIIAKKTGEPVNPVFIDPDFSFPQYRTPVPRTVKGEKARETAGKSRTVLHRHFRLLDVDVLGTSTGNTDFVYGNLSKL